MDGYVDPESCATYLYPVVCFLTESEFMYYYSRNKDHDSEILFEYEENKAKSLINELKIGEKSKLVKDFDHKANLKKLHAKHLSK